MEQVSLGLLRSDIRSFSFESGFSGSGTGFDIKAGTYVTGAALGFYF